MSEYADERRDIRQARMAAAIDAGTNEGEAFDQAFEENLAERGYEIEYDEPEPEPETWNDHGGGEVEWTEDEPDEPEYVDPDAHAQAVMAEFEAHVSELEQESGVRLSQRQRRDLTMDGLQRGGLTRHNTEMGFLQFVRDDRNAAEDSVAQEEQELQFQRLSHDPEMRRRARRALMVRTMERGNQ